MSTYSLMRHEEVKKLVNRQIYALNRHLQSIQGGAGVSLNGSSLNPSELSRTYSMHKMGKRNPRAMRNYTIDPTISCAVSIVVDVSGSMSEDINFKKKPYRMTSYTECIYALDSMVRAFDGLGIKSRVGLCDLNWQGNKAKASTGSAPVVYELKGEKEKWKDQITKDVVGLQPWTGTDVISYAKASIDMVKQMKATHKIAFFMTDMADSGVREKLLEMGALAKAEGIHLVGLGFMQVSSRDNYYKYSKASYESSLPNCICGANADEICEILIPELIKILK